MRGSTDHKEIVRSHRHLLLRQLDRTEGQYNRCGDDAGHELILHRTTKLKDKYGITINHNFLFFIL